MKSKIIITALVLLLSGLVKADVSEPKSLKEAMKAMKTRLESVANNLERIESKDANIKLIEEFIFLVDKSKNFIPDTADTAQLKNEYKADLENVITLATELKTDISKEDFAAGRVVLQKLVEAKKEGHADFKN